jgi:hypothetical protein
MISFQINKRDLMNIAKIEVKNLPGTFFVGASPLLKPLIKKLECMLPIESTGRGDNYTLSALHSHVTEVHANEFAISIKGQGTQVEIGRDELMARISKKYPFTEHQKLNLPGLLLLQSSPSIQVVSTAKLRSEHKLRIPDGRRTLRYIYHLGVVSIDADQQRIRIVFDPERLPKKADGTGVLE